MEQLLALALSTGAGQLTVAFIAGILPALIWLMFWRQEDRARPEPRGLVLRAFIAGMIAVFIVIPLQRIALDYITFQILLITVWAGIEEVTKLVIAWIAVLRNRAVDEPLDPIMYMITVALGFAALENTLFLLTPLADGQIVNGFVTGNLRFIGATLIHTLSSGLIGLALASSFFKSRYMKFIYGFSAVILAILLHTLFNFLIITTNGDKLLTVFLGVWIGIIALLLFFERIKQMKRPSWWQRVFIKK